VHFVG